MELEVVLDRLAEATWAPEGRQYLLTAVSRLRSLLGDDELAALTGINLEMLQTLSGQVAEVASRSSSAFARLKRLTDDTSSEAHMHHPFFGIRDAHPGFVILLTALASNHHLSYELDKLLSDIVRVVLNLNRSFGFDTYQTKARAALRSRLRGEPVDLQDCQPSAHLLRILSRSLRRFIQLASQELADPKEVATRWEQFQKSARSFLSNPHRARRHVHRPDGLKREARSGSRHKDGPEQLNVRSPVRLEAIEFAPQELDDEQESVEQHIYPRGTFAKARALDLSPVELELPVPTVGQKVNEHHSARTAVIDGRYQAKLLENRAQLLLWSTTNLTPFQIRTLRESLLSTASELSVRGFNTAWLLVSLVSGRRPMMLPGKVILDARLRQVEELASYNESDAQVVLLTGIQGIALRINQTPVITRLDSLHAQETQQWIIVPDYLSVGDLLTGQLRQLQLSEDLSQLKPSMVRQSIEQALVELSTLGFSESHVWQLLPRVMQNESGMSTGMAMLTDWRTANSIVELHYHCVPATTLVSRYQAAMSIITEGFDGRYLGLDQRLPQQSHYVGAPNCPTSKFTRGLIKQIKDKLSKPMPLQERHNLLTLYALVMATAGFGLRHAISPQIEFTTWADRAVVSYREKNELRQLVLPRMVHAQLLALQTSLQTTSFDAAFQDRDDTVRFTLLDDNCRSRELRPGRFGKELAKFGIEFPFELNAYRRWMFSQLFIAGLRGISTDHFGGHGVAGREPLSMFSATTLHSLEAVADIMDQRLADAGFEVLT